MLPRTIKRWQLAVVLATAAGWPTNGLRAQDARPVLGKPESERVVVELSPELLEELQGMKQQLEELRHSDAAKSKQIEDLQWRLDRHSDVREPDLAEVGPLILPAQPNGQEPKQDAKSALDRAVRDIESKSPSSLQESELDRAVRGLPPSGSQGPIYSAGVGGGLQLQIMDISVDVLAAAGFSTERDESLQSLQGGHHDPRKRGFMLQGAEINFQGAVDPYLFGNVTVAYVIDPIEGETIVELEEAWFNTTSLPCGYQIKGGHFFTNFGRINPTHAHAWHWMDQPIINSRMFGADGMRNPGIEFSRLLPMEPTTHVYFAMQNANGETASSFFASDEFFEEAAIGGRPFVEQEVRDLGDLLYSARVETSWECGEETTWLAGLSGAVGPNATGPDGDTAIVGADLTMKWRAATNERGWPFIIWQSEIMARKYRADDFFDEGDPIDPADDIDLGGETLRDWGFYTQLYLGCQVRWAYGIRYEFARGNGPSLDPEAGFAEISRDDDPFRDTRHRVSPLVAFYPTEFSRFRLQYNYDVADHLSRGDAHSLWLGAEFILGAHPAHKF